VAAAAAVAKLMLCPLGGRSGEPGPVVGRNLCGSIAFDGMDDWLWELYHCHRPRAAPLPSSFDHSAVVRALDKGMASIWDGFADEHEVSVAHAELEAMMARGELSLDSTAWLNECAEGGHARNRVTLQGQRRDDAYGFWNLQGAGPAPPPGVSVLFRRLEAAAAELRAKFGWPLLCSRLGGGAVYDGKGACYTQHRDNEWQRHLRPRTPRALRTSASREGAWMNFRELTMMTYVNLPGAFDDSEAGRRDGGRLRCYAGTKRGDLVGGTAVELQDVAPIGGRAVIFRSRELLHEVLPCYARRYALVLWVCTAL